MTLPPSKPILQHLCLLYFIPWHPTYHYYLFTATASTWLAHSCWQWFFCQEMVATATEATMTPPAWDCTTCWLRHDCFQMYQIRIGVWHRPPPWHLTHHTASFYINTATFIFALPHSMASHRSLLSLHSFCLLMISSLLLTMFYCEEMVVTATQATMIPLASHLSNDGQVSKSVGFTTAGKSRA